MLLKYDRQELRVPDLTVRTSAFCEFTMIDGAKALLG